MKLNFRNRTTFLTFLAIAGILVLLEAFLLHRGKKAARLVQQNLSTKTQEVSSLVQSSQVSLNQENVNLFKTEHDQMKNRYENLISKLDTSQAAKKDLSPLEFKEELLKTQQLLVERANLWNIKVHSAIGFEEYEGGNIPSPSDVPQLALQLESIKTLINFLIESRISEIEKLSKYKIQAIALAPNQEVYQILTFDLRVKGDIENIQLFLQKISSSTHLFIIRKLDIDLDPSGKLAINMRIDSIKLKRT